MAGKCQQLYHSLTGYSVSSRKQRLCNKCYPPLADGSGYIISFKNSGAITIKHGTTGDTPIIGISQYTDGKYYWTVNGGWLLDNGNMIPTTGDDGLTPYIGENGNWWLGTTDTGIKASGEDGNNGLTPYIGENGNWWLGPTDTGVKARGEDGTDGLTPFIGANGNWWIGITDTGVNARGDNGSNGLTPFIGANGNWWIGTTDTGMKAQGENGTSIPAPRVRINTISGEWEVSNDGGTIWTATGVKAYGTNGSSAQAPQVRINSTSGKWEISTNGGSSWVSTGVQAQGDAMFTAGGIDNSDADYVSLTLASGSTIRLPKYKAIQIGNAGDSNEAVEISKVSTKIALYFPGLKQENYRALMAQVISNQGTGSDIKIAAATTPWTVTIKKPTFTSTGVCDQNASVTVNAPDLLSVGETALLKVSLVDNNGGIVTTTRTLVALDFWDGTIATAFAGGSGTSASPFVIEDGRQLAYLAQQINNGTTTYEGIYFKLSKDILLGERAWTPIGNDIMHPFKGNFDGNGKIIYGVKINKTYAAATGENYSGLFGYVGAGTVKELRTQVNIYLSVEFGDPISYLGGIVGKCATGVSVSNLSSYGQINAEFGLDVWMTGYFGSVIGWMEDGATATQSINTNALNQVSIYYLYEHYVTHVVNGVLQ